MSDFKAIMHQNRFRLELRHRPRSWNKEDRPTCKGKKRVQRGEREERWEMAKQERGGKRRKRGGKGVDGPCVSVNFP